MRMIGNKRKKNIYKMKILSVRMNDIKAKF